MSSSSSVEFGRSPRLCETQNQNQNQKEKKIENQNKTKQNITIKNILIY